MSITQPLIDRLLKDQRGACWKCGRDLYKGYHVHHACITRDKRFAKYLDQAENLLLICPRCHSNHGNLSNIKTRRQVWQWKKAHGYDMDKWQEDMNMKITDKFE